MTLQPRENVHKVKESKVHLFCVWFNAANVMRLANEGTKRLLTVQYPSFFMSDPVWVRSYALWFKPADCLIFVPEVVGDCFSLVTSSGNKETKNWFADVCMHMTRLVYKLS
jgi:hypothetical protein